MSIEYKIGPNTAGLAQKIEIKQKENSNKYESKLYILKKNYLEACLINQF